jgi:anti-sigma28 factor (negative regulator of flagellin synthesis)
MPKERARLIGQPMQMRQGLRDMRLSEIQQQIGRGEYRVDGQAVADAIVRRLLAGHKHASTDDKRGQAECS